MQYKIKFQLIPILLFAVIVFGFSFNFSFAAGGALAPGSPCNLDTECQTGNCVPSGSGKICQNPVWQGAGELSITFGAPTQTTTFKDFICNITVFLSDKIVAPIAVLMALVVGFLYLMSQGDPSKLKTANTVLLFTVLGVAVLLLSPGIVSLASSLFGGSFASTSCSVQASTNVITDAIINLVNWMSWLIAIVAVCAGLYSGFLYMTASGRAEQVSKASKIFLFAVIGIVVAILAFSIISITKVFL